MATVAETLGQALQLQQSGQFPAAEAACRQALEMDPENIEALHFLGVVYQTQGRIDDCIAVYGRCLALNPNVAETHNNLGAAYAAQKRPDQALSCYLQAVRLRPDYEDAQKNLRILLNLSASPASPDQAAPAASAEALNAEGVALLGQGRRAQARARWEAALKLKDLPDAHSNLGFLHAAEGNLEQAVVCYRRALALQPEHADALSNLGIVHVRQQHLDEAADCFRRALVAKPNFPEALTNLGNIHLMQQRPAEAIACYRKMLTLRAGDAAAYDHLGAAHTMLRRWDDAIACWRRSLELNPRSAATCRHLANTLNISGRYREAAECYEKVLAAAPDDIEARALVDALRGKAPPQLPRRYVTELFDGYAPQFDHNLRDVLNYRGPEALKAALEPAPPPPGLAILDLGCGTGLCGREFRAWARTLIGVDLSPKMLEQARKRGVYDEVIESDLLPALEARERRFDLILAGDVFVYIGDLQAIFTAVYRALRPGGRFAFTVERLDEGDGFRLQPTVRYAHSRSYLHETAAKAGLKELQMQEIVIRTENGQPIAGSAVVLAHP